MKIAVIGESNIDIAVAPHAELNAKCCVPGDIAFHHGGVARNIAHNLCLLGHDVKLVSVFGDDDFAERMVADCKQIGMDLSLSDQFKEAKSPIFLSFNDNTGNMVSAVSDVSLNDYMDLDWLKDKMAAINTSDVVVADTLLSTNALAVPAVFLVDHTHDVRIPRGDVVGDLAGAILGAVVDDEDLHPLPAGKQAFDAFFHVVL